MLGNHLKMASRNMVHHKGYTAINILGMASGMVCAYLIFLWAQDELSYDTFHEHAQEIYRVNIEDRFQNGTSHHYFTPFPLAKALEEQFPEIAAATRTRWDHFMVKYQDKLFNETNCSFVDPAFFEIFSFPMLMGNPAHALDSPNSIVITDKIAKKYFGKQPPLNKIMTLDNRVDVVVSGVIQVPRDSDFQVDLFLPFKAVELFNVDLSKWEADWKAKNYITYVLLKKNTSSLRLEKKISGLLKAHNPEKNEILKLQALTALHLYNPDGTGAGIKYVVIFSIIAVFILLIACINFMNLATARSEKRAKEVGLRKAIGADRAQVMKQFYIESFLIAWFSFALALVLLELLLPVFNSLWEKELTLDFTNLRLLLGFLGVVLFTGIMAGSYPALFLSSFQPLEGIKGLFFSTPRGTVLRKILVIVQFTLAAILIISTIIVYSQLNYLQTKDPGLDKEHLVYLLMEGESKFKYETVKSELLKNPGIISAAACNFLPSNVLGWVGDRDWEGKLPGQEINFAYSVVDYDYIPTFKMEIKLGRNFSPGFPSDIDNVILNEEAVRQMGLESPLGKQFERWRGGKKGKIIGVIKDFHFQHLRYKIAPLLLSLQGENKRYLVIRLKPGDPGAMIDHFKQVWNRVNPGFLFEYHFFDENYDRYYRGEQRLGKILFSFALLAILISCLGLFGLASFIAEQRTKEIGIRKVVGSTMAEIVLLFSKEYIKWVIISNLISWPVAYIAMSRWLQSFAYRAAIEVWPFMLSTALALVIALLTVSFHSLKAAAANPVEALRYE